MMQAAKQCYCQKQLINPASEKNGCSHTRTKENRPRKQRHPLVNPVKDFLQVLGFLIESKRTKTRLNTQIMTSE